MKLSHRLETIASFVPKGSIVADIGTDHGYIPIWLLQQKIAVKAIAMDIGEGPLKRAREHIVLYGLEDLIETRLSNGLSGLYPKEADTVVIAGMGGELISWSIVPDGDQPQDVQIHAGVPFFRCFEPLLAALNPSPERRIRGDDTRKRLF